MAVMIPQLRFKEFADEWQVTPLGKLAKVYDGTHQTPTYVSSGVPFYSVEQVTANDFTNTKYVSEGVYLEESKRVIIERDDILMTRIGDIGTSKHISWEPRASYYVSLALIKKSEKYNSKFLDQYIKTSIFQKELWKRTIHVAFPIKINLGEISNCLVTVPAKPEQEKIADFLTAVDDKISKLKQKKTQFEKYKKGVMQAIFSQEVRFKKTDGSNYPDWAEKKLRDIIIESNEKTEESKQFPTLSSTSRGLFRQDEYFNKEIASTDSTGYKILRMNQLVFSPQNLWLGNINVNRKYQIGIVSPSYKIFNFVKSDINFCENLMKSNRMMYEYAQVSEQGASVVRRNLDMNSFMAIRVSLPAIEEQVAIGNTFTDLNCKIELISKELEGAKKFKKALLQQMFV